MNKLMKLLCAMMFGVMALSFCACGGDDDNEDSPEMPSSSVKVTPDLLQGTWKGNFESYTGIRDELMTIYWGDPSLRIWWTHYKNLDQYHFRGDFSVKDNKLTLKGKYGKNGGSIDQDYERTVPIYMSEDHNTIKFEFDCDTWVLTRRG